MRAARPRRPARRASFRRRALAALSRALLVALVPLSILAANPFTDLNPGSVHNDNIDAIYNAGVTTGCVPNAEYCPNDYVTRQEMASFLARLGGLGANPPVANAKTAENAGAVDGKSANELLRISRDTSDAFVALPLAPGFQQIVSTTISVPGPGFVLVTGITGVGGEGVAKVLLRDTTGALSDQKGTELDTTVNSATVTVQHVFQVNGAGQKTYELMGQKSTNTALVAGGTAGDGNAATITALYIPFGSTGTTAP